MIVLANVLNGIAFVLGGLLKVYFWVVLIAVLLTWVRPDPYNPIVRTLNMLTEPVFYRIRKWLPFTYKYGMDFSPVIVLLGIQLLEWIVIKSLIEYARVLS